MAARNRGYGLAQDRGLINDFFNTYSGVTNMLAGNNAYQQQRHQYDMMQAQLPLQLMQLEQDMRTQQAQDAIQRGLLSGAINPDDAAVAYNAFGASPRSMAGSYWQQKQFEDNQRLALMKLADDRKYQMMMAKAAMSGGGKGAGGGKPETINPDQFYDTVNKVVNDNPGMSRADAIDYVLQLRAGFNPEYPRRALQDREAKRKNIDTLQRQYDASRKADEQAYNAARRAEEKGRSSGGPATKFEGGYSW